MHVFQKLSYELPFNVLLISSDIRFSSMPVCRICSEFIFRFLNSNFSQLFPDSTKWKSCTVMQIGFGNGGWKPARTATACWVLRNPDLDLCPQSWCREPCLVCVCKPTFCVNTKLLERRAVAFQLQQRGSRIFLIHLGNTFLRDYHFCTMKYISFQYKYKQIC